MLELHVLRCGHDLGIDLYTDAPIGSDTPLRTEKLYDGDVVFLDTSKPSRDGGIKPGRRWQYRHVMTMDGKYGVVMWFFEIKGTFLWQFERMFPSDVETR